MRALVDMTASKTILNVFKEIEDYHFKHNMIIARKYEEYVTAVDVEIPYFNTIH